MALKKLLLEFDSNKDGVLTLEELRRLGRDFSIPYGEVCLNFKLTRYLSKNQPCQI